MDSLKAISMDIESICYKAERLGEKPPMKEFNWGTGVDPYGNEAHQLEERYEFTYATHFDRLRMRETWHAQALIEDRERELKLMISPS